MKALPGYPIRIIIPAIAPQRDVTEMRLAVHHQRIRLLRVCRTLQSIMWRGR